MANETHAPLYAIGLMSGTSLDGIDAALLKTDGNTIQHFGPSLTLPYPKKIKEMLLNAHRMTDYLMLEQQLTKMHADAVHRLLSDASMSAKDVQLLGFHGQTLHHDPRQSLSWQIGNPALLAESTGISVISDFRRRDVAAGGQGAPLVPLFHQAIVGHWEKPLMVVNIGGVANITYVGSKGELVACDVGPGNALIDDWVRLHGKGDYDIDGGFASKGKADLSVCEEYFSHSFFDKPPPKSLDRNEFSLDLVKGMSLEDGAATLTMVTAKAIAHSARWFADAPEAWYVAGGGSHNKTMMRMLGDYVKAPVEMIDNCGYKGDAIEAQAFAYLAVRSYYKLPITLPTTTGVTRPLTGGAFYHA